MSRKLCYKVSVVQVWNLKTLTMVKSFSGLHHWVRALAVSPDKVSSLPLRFCWAASLPCISCVSGLSLVLLAACYLVIIAYSLCCCQNLTL